MLEIITKRSANQKLDRVFGYVGRNVVAGSHKHSFRCTFIPMFFFVGFVCRTCDTQVLVERDLWNAWIR